METKDILCSSLDEFGLEISEDMIERCVDLCITHSRDPHEFAEDLFTFTVNGPTGIEVLESTLDDFERKVLTNCKPNRKATKNTTQQNANFQFDEIDSDGENDEVMDAYICTTPKAKKVSQIRGFSTPSSSLKDSFPMDSPILIPMRDATGKVVYTFGASQLIKSINWINTNQKQTINFEILYENLSAEQNFMYDNLLQKTSIAADRIFDIGDEICTKLIKDHTDVYDKDLHNEAFKMGDATQSVMKCVGRICSDSDCQLDLHSTLLIGADEICLRTFRLHFDRLKSFALFPGQTVFVQGVNPRADSFFVDEIISDRDLTYAALPDVKEDLSIIVATGPFTGPNDLNYEPLNDLMAYCQQHKPDVLILLGPFLDADHPAVLNGWMKSSYEEYFEYKIADLANKIGSDTEVYIVASNQDVHSTAVFPTAPYTIGGKPSPYKNITFLPDPCIIKLNGVTLAMTATDIYNHILDAEIAVNAGDKVKRVANHLFQQATFYPLNPPSDKVSVDTVLAQQFAALPIVPNLLILKSQAKCFAREVKGSDGRSCLVLNPGSMYENSANGTFGRLVITPKNDGSAPLNSIIGCQIIKI